MDVFDGLPDAIVVDILNKVGDVRTLLRCSSLSKRFNSLVPQSESLILRLDHQDSDSLSDSSPVGKVFQSLFKSFHGFLSLFSKPAKPIQTTTPSPSIPSKILSRFDRIRDLEVELPGGDAKVEKGAAVKWKAEFGKTLKSCVVVAFRSAATVPSSTAASDGESDSEFVAGMKTRVVWTISSLVSASTRHYMMGEVVKKHEEMKSLVIGDGGGEGTVVMDSEGLREFRKTEEARGEDEEEKRVGKNRRSVVPSVRMSMRHAPSLKLKSGICLESATLVIVRPSEEYSDVGDDELATGAFGGDCMYGEAVVALLKRKKSSLKMNSF